MEHVRGNFGTSESLDTLVLKILVGKTVVLQAGVGPRRQAVNVVTAELKPFFQICTRRKELKTKTPTRNVNSEAQVVCG
jgi:hypothetical protein